MKQKYPLKIFNITVYFFPLQITTFLAATYTDVDQ